MSLTDLQGAELAIEEYRSRLEMVLSRESATIERYDRKLDIADHRLQVVSSLLSALARDRVSLDPNTLAPDHLAAAICNACGARAEAFSALVHVDSCLVGNAIALCESLKASAGVQVTYHGSSVGLTHEQVAQLVAAERRLTWRPAVAPSNGGAR